MYPWPICKACSKPEIDLIILNWNGHNSNMLSFSSKIIYSYQKKIGLPKVIGQNAFYQQQTAQQTLKYNNSAWNAGHVSGWNVANWCVFDFEIPTQISSFGLIHCGDYSHDIKDFSIQITKCDELNQDKIKKDSLWFNIHNLTFKAKPNTTEWQIFNFKSVKSRYFKIYIINRYSQYQAWVQRFAFKTVDFYHSNDMKCLVDWLKENDFHQKELIQTLKENKIFTIELFQNLNSNQLRTIWQSASDKMYQRLQQIRNKK